MKYKDYLKLNEDEAGGDVGGGSPDADVTFGSDLPKDDVELPKPNTCYTVALQCHKSQKK